MIGIAQMWDEGGSFTKEEVLRRGLVNSLLYALSVDLLTFPPFWQGEPPICQDAAQTKLSPCQAKIFATPIFQQK